MADLVSTPVIIDPKDPKWAPYAALEPDADLNEAALVGQAMLPEATPDDHLEIGLEHQALAQALLPSAQGLIAAAAAYVHLAAAGQNPLTMVQDTAPEGSMPLVTVDARVSPTGMLKGKKRRPKPTGFSDPAGRRLNDATEAFITLSKAGGEGSRGGHIIGHTRNGHPIYSHDHEAYKNVRSFKDFKEKDHSHRQGVTARRIISNPGRKANDDFVLARREDVIAAFPHYGKKDHQDAAAAHIKSVTSLTDTPEHEIRHRDLFAGHRDAANKKGWKKSLPQAASSGEDMLKATRYQGLSGHDMDHVQRVHKDAVESGRVANQSGKGIDHASAAGAHMSAARIHKQYVPQSRDRVLFHLKEARYHAKQAGIKPPRLLKAGGGSKAPASRLFPSSDVSTQTFMKNR